LAPGPRLFLEEKDTAKGLANAKLVLKNPRLSDIESLEVNALADTGATHLCIPEHVRVQLRLEEIERKEVVLADGSRASFAYVGPIELRFKNRTGFSGALVMGQQVLGSYPNGRYGSCGYTSDEASRYQSNESQHGCFVCDGHKRVVHLQGIFFSRLQGAILEACLFFV